MLSLLQHTKSICEKYNIRPLRRRGQNFLISPYVIKKIITAAELKKDDIVVEVGAGLGALTKAIARHVKKVIAIEIDKKMINVLNNELRNFKNVELVQGDIRENYDSLVSRLPMGSRETERGKRGSRETERGWKVIANLPFNITGFVLREFLERDQKPALMVLIVQKEVGERITAQPPKMSLLAVSVQFYAHVRVMATASKRNFWPKPRVDSMILKIIPFGSSAPNWELSSQDTQDIRNVDEGQFFKVVKAGFLHPRKYLLNNLATLPFRPPTSMGGRGSVLGLKGGRGSTTFKNSAIIKNTRTLEHENIRTQEQKQELTKIFKDIGLNPRVRAQELSVEKWAVLSSKLCQ